MPRVHWLHAARRLSFNGEHWYWFIWYSNQSTPDNNDCAYVYLDDIAISTVGYIGPLGAPAPTCNDAIQNQGESGIDCGGPCPACSGAPRPQAPTDLRLSVTP